MEQHISTLIRAFTDELFKFEPVTCSTRLHKKFLSEMIMGVLGSRSTVVANIGRFLNEPIALQSVEDRLCKMLRSRHLPWNGLRVRATDIAARSVSKDDIIAFDPGDVTKKYAKKMAYLYPVHDGSTGKIALGWESFGIEAIHWEAKRKTHIPLYDKLTNASCPDYVSQNHQIIEAIKAVYSQFGDEMGIWTFDRLHDRSILFKFLLTLKMRWIVRLKFNRKLRFVDNDVTIKLEDFISIVELSKASWRFLFPKRSGHLHVAWRKVKLPNNNSDLTLVLVQDERNEKPVAFLTTLPVHDDLSATMAFGFYLERWGKEEGYRFTKSYLNLENLRTFSWDSIQNLASTIHLSYLFICWLDQRHGDEIDKLCSERLKTFHPVESIHYRYYRVGQLIQMLLWEQNGLNPGALAMTEVG